MARIIDLRKKDNSPAPAEMLPTSRSAVLSALQQKHVDEEGSDTGVFAWEASGEPTRKRFSVLVWILVFALFIGAFVLQENILAALLGILAAIVFLLQGRRNAQRPSVVIDESGFVIGNRTYGLHMLKSFWITVAPGRQRELSLEFKTRFLPYLKVPLGRQDPVPLRIFLSAHLPEREHEPSLIDEFVHAIGF